MNFEKEIIKYERNTDIFSYRSKKGKLPIILTAVHTVEQRKENGVKFAEQFTAAISQYVGNKINSSYLIKSIDNGIDSNSKEEDEFKKVLLKNIKENNIKLLIDLHVASPAREFDIELGTLSNQTMSYTTQATLIDHFKQSGIQKVSLNSKFRGAESLGMYLKILILILSKLKLIIN